MCLRCAHLGLVTMLSWLLHSASSALMVCAVSLGNLRAIMGHCTHTQAVLLPQLFPRLAWRQDKKDKE